MEICFTFFSLQSLLYNTFLNFVFICLLFFFNLLNRGGSYQQVCFSAKLNKSLFQQNSMNIPSSYYKIWIDVLTFPNHVLCVHWDMPFSSNIPHNLNIWSIYSSNKLHNNIFILNSQTSWTFFIQYFLNAYIGILIILEHSILPSSRYNDK